MNFGTRATVSAKRSGYGNRRDVSCRWSQVPVAGAWVSLALACGGGGGGGAGAAVEAGAPTTSEAPEPGLPVGEVHARLDFTRPGAPTGDLIGWSLGRETRYAPEDDPLHPEWRTQVRSAALQSLAEVRPGHGRAPLMRFASQVDGARGEDGYHFLRWVEPGRAAAPDDEMATFEYFALMHEADAAPVVGLNFGSGTPAEAAAYATHLNGTRTSDPAVAARVRWGMAQPYRQTLFELGDELYSAANTGHVADGAHSYANPQARHGGDLAWHGRPGRSAANVAARGLAYASAIRAVEPEARLWAPLSRASMDAWGGVEAATGSLAPLLADPAVEAAAVHHDLVDDARPLGWDDPNDPFFLLAGVERFRPEYRRLRAALDAVRPGLPIVVSDYHVAGPASRGRYTRGDQAVAGLAIAGMLIFYAQEDVRAACQRLSLGFEPAGAAWDNPFRAEAGGVAAAASYVTTRVVAEHLLERTAPLEFVKQVRRDMSFGSTTVEVPLVHAAAFVDPVGEAGALLALHRDLQRSRTLTLDLPPGWVATAGTIVAPPTLEHDGRALAPAPLAWVQEGARVQVTLPPHSLAALRFADQ